MALFRKKKDTATSLCNAEGKTDRNAVISGAVDVKILGSGCAKCNALETAVREALEQLGVNVIIDHVSDFSQIAAYGVMTTPALVVNGTVVSLGKVLKTEEAVKLLQKYLEN